MGVAARPRLLSLERVVTSPDGRTWRVRRRWRLRRPRWWRPNLDDTPFDAADALTWLPDDHGIFGFLTAIGLAIVAITLIVVFLLPLVVLVADAFLIAVSVVVLGRSWIVEAQTDGLPPETLRVDCGGWLGSRRAVAEVADAIRRGAPLPRA